MKVFLSLLILCIMSAPCLGAELRAKLDRQDVALGESFTLTLHSDRNLSKSPDLTPLRNDFIIIGQSKRSNLSFVNGKTSSSTEWTIRLSPKKSGYLTIPRLHLDKMTSNELHVNIEEKPTSPSDDSDVFIKVQTQPSSLYPGAQLSYRVRLYHNADLIDGNLSAPQAANAEVIDLNKSSQFQAQLHNKTYNVIERFYVIIPKHAGQLQITAPILRAHVADETQTRRGPFSMLIAQREITRIGETLTVDVKPLPGNGQEDLITAQGMALSESWSQNPPKFQVGEPITRTLNIQAFALRGEQIPNLQPRNIDGFKVYPDKAEVLSKTRGRWLNGSRVEKVALIPERSGKLTLPAIHLPWLNSETGQREVLSVPERHVTVAPAPNMAPTPTTAPPLPKAPEQPSQASIKTHTYSWAWISATLFFALAWLSTLAYIGYQRRSRPGDSDTTQQASLRQLRQRLQHACQQNDARTAESTLLAWTQSKWPEAKFTNLISLQCLSADPAWSSALRNLNESLYAAHQPRFDGAALLACLDNLSLEQQEAREDKALPPLYPE